MKLNLSIGHFLPTVYNQSKSQVHLIFEFILIRIVSSISYVNYQAQAYVNISLNFGEEETDSEEILVQIYLRHTHVFY